MQSDPISEMLTIIRNGLMAGHKSIVTKKSTMKIEIIKIMKDKGFIKYFEIIKNNNKDKIEIVLAYQTEGNPLIVGLKKPVIQGLKKISTPGLRVYVKKPEIPRVFGGLGIAIISTSQGILTGTDASKRNLGGELLCYVW